MIFVFFWVLGRVAEERTQSIQPRSWKFDQSRQADSAGISWETEGLTLALRGRGSQLILAPFLPGLRDGAIADHKEGGEELPGWVSSPP